MTIRDVLVPLAPGIEFEPQFDAAAQLAQALDANISIVFTRDAMVSAASVPEMLVAAGVFVEAIERETELAETSAITRFEQWRAINNLAAVWHERTGGVADTIAEVGRASDLVVIGRPDADRTVTDEIFRAAIYSTGHPALIVPDRLTGKLLDHVLIAWNGSVEAARAVAGAMTMLEAANRVSIFAVQETSKALHHHLGLIEHLEHHGVHAECVESGSCSSHIGQQLAATANQEKVTMIVMGAYTHHRVQQVFLGGVTRHMANHAEIPVLMMH